VLVTRLPGPLAPLAELAYDLRWLWQPECRRLFASIDEGLFRECGENPVDLLLEATPATLRQRAEDPAFLARMQSVVSARAADLQRPYASAAPASPAHPIAFFCSEFALHSSLSVYAGGLGVLAGDYLKEASDRALPVVGVGLLYRSGYFHQRLDASGWQHEYWTPVRRAHLPIEPALSADGSQLQVRVPIADREVVASVWRATVGRVPLFLLDTDVADNPIVDRFITAQLYVGDRELRLLQYLVLGIGGVRALRALGVDPSIVHLNEGHAAFAALELAREQVAGGRSFPEAWGKVRERLVFTTHTPVAAGNENYTEGELRVALASFAPALRASWQDVFALGHSGGEASQSFGMTALALRAARAANGVSRRHGEVARAMWRGVYPAHEPVPIGHVTNGVHVPTWMSEPIAELLTRYLGGAWRERAADPRTWDGVENIPAAELWSVRCALRRTLVDYVRTRSVEDRLARGDGLGYVETAAKSFDPELLTVGFARRVASYKRLHLLTWDMSRALGLLCAQRPIQVVIAGKAHPRDDDAKRIVQVVFGMKSSPIVGARVAFLEDYDMTAAARLVAGCDVWINVPRPPLEASGTSGMKAMLNGGLNLSVLDGWWQEAFDGQNGWAIHSETGPDDRVQDTHDSDQLYSLLEREVVPLFYDRDAAGIPRGWVTKIKTSLRTLGPRFSASRMLEDYRTERYAEQAR
jgi:starch phosphorylase